MKWLRVSTATAAVALIANMVAVQAQGDADPADGNDFIRKHNEDMPYHGSVRFVDNDADLALVGVDDPAFMEGIAPMEIGETPHVQDDVLAVGYPRGGEDISYTRGIVSRIEDVRYSHGWTCLLAVQVDAAINPGNSGGPVPDMRSGKIAGIGLDRGDEWDVMTVAAVLEEMDSPDAPGPLT